jgi:hypothetical protein
VPSPDDLVEVNVVKMMVSRWEVERYICILSNTN